MRKFIPSFVSHIARYNHAMLYCFKTDVLDVGSKEGFGAHLLSYGAKSVTLLDINQGYLDFAKSYYKFFCPAQFIQYDLNKGFPEGEWDAMTAFEVIEHVEDPDFLIKNMTEHLKPGGFLVFSVPHMVANEEHLTLFDEVKIRALISKYLDIKEFYVQDKRPFSGDPLYKKLVCYVGVAQKRVL